MAKRKLNAKRRIRMEGLFLIIIMIMALTLGICFNNSFEKEFFVPAIQTVPCILQCIAMISMLVNIPNPDVTGWFILGVVLVVVTYVIAFIACKNNAENVGAEGGALIKAIVAQLILPIGVALLIFVVIAMLCNRNKKKKK
jgi:hypothetical protein